MKRIVNMISGKGFLTIAVASAYIIAGCNGSSSDYNKDSATTTASTTDTTVITHQGTDVHTDSAHLALTNDSLVMAADARKVAMADPNSIKTAKKGKVTIVMAEPAVNKNTVMEMDKEGYYKYTEVLPGYPGGQKALERFFEDNIQYPPLATENDAQGTVKLTFSVDENGKIYQPLVVGDKVGYGIEEEAIRVFNKMPTWTPGKIKGRNVKTRYTLPIRFQLY
ncbi:MAG: energy transducer TonB [Ferruginibacter sp.]